MAPSAGESYQYDTLPAHDFIRLLQILPSSGEDIICTLTVIDLRQSPLYDCLSYTWGDPLYRFLSPPQDTGEITNERIFPISCNRKVVHVTQNLRDALLQLNRRQQEKQGYIWIDAMCINQESIPERNSQVAMMKRIYKSAQTVIVWLGISDFHIEQAMTVMNHLSSIAVDYQKLELPSDLEDHEMYRLLGIPDIGPQQWLDLAAFLQRTWFSRIWVLQETSVAQNIIVLCGSHVLAWSCIAATAKFLQETHTSQMLMSTVTTAVTSYSTSTTHVANTLSNPFIFENLRERATILTLKKLLTDSRYFEATDDRDRVFAILGLWDRPPETETLPIQICADYQLDVKTVFTTAAWATIYEMKDLNLISQVEDFSFRRLSTLPSWVPDYSVPPKWQPLTDNLRATQGQERWAASKGLPFTPSLQTDLFLLPVNAIKIDTITNFAATAAEITDQFMTKSLLTLLNDCLQDPYSDNRALIEAFWRTLIKDTFSSQPADAEARAAFPLLIIMAVWELETELVNLQNFIQDVDPPLGPLDPSRLTLAHLSAVYTQTKALITSLSRREDVVDVIPTWEGVQRMIEMAKAYDEADKDVLEREKKKQLDRTFDAIAESFRVAYSGRRMFVTKMMFLGLAAQSLCKGDMVWVVAGLSVPVVLRPVQGEKWKVVGEAYVHGFMNGEAVRGCTGGVGIGSKGVERIFLE